MKIIYNKETKLINKTNLVKLTFDVKFNEQKTGFNDFDIDEMQNSIDIFFDNLKKEIITLDSENTEFYTLSKLLFNKFDNLKTIEYNNETLSSIIDKKDVL